MQNGSTMDNQETFNEWLAQDFILDEITKSTPDVNERLVRMYDYFLVFQEFEDEVEENM